MKRNRFQFITSIALIFMLCMSTVTPIFADTPITRVFAASDYQAKTGDAEGEGILGSIIDTMINDGHITVDGALYAGDYDYNMPSDTSHGINSIKNVFKSKWSSLSEDNMVFAKGNHDPASTPGISSSGANDAEDYGVFVINESDYMWFNNDRGTVQRTANNLKGYLDDKLVDGYSKPIFVVSHLPLHYSMRTRNDGDAQYANLLFDVLNEAGAEGLNIIFLFGHDHSNGWDDYLGGSCIYLAKGDSINIAQSSRTEWKAETLNFTYMNPGYTGYYNQVNTSAEDILSSTMFTIYENRVEVNRYTTSGKYNLKSKGVRNSYKNESGYDLDTRIITSPDDIDLNKIKARPSVKIINDGMDIVPVGGAISLTAEISNVENPTFEWSSSNPDILSVEGNGNTVLVYASSKGEATINLSVTDGSDSTVTRASFDATAVDVTDGNVYTLVNKASDIVSGDKYFMIFTDTKNTLPKYNVVSHEVMTNGGRTGLVPKDIGLNSDVDYLTGDYSDYEWTFTGLDGNYVISCDKGVLSIASNDVNLNGAADHVIKITDGMSGLYLTDNNTNYQLSDSSKGIFSGYASGKQFSLYRKIDITQAPGKPQDLLIVTGDKTATLSWEAPKADGGSAITGYQVSNDGITWIDTVDNSYTFNNLINGTEYSFCVRAVNSHGAGATASIAGTPDAEDLKPSKDLLAGLISKANGLNSADYTEKTWKVLEEEVLKAKAVFEDPDASEAEIKAVEASLTKAISQLVLKTKDEEAKGSVKTGDNSLIGGLVGLGVLSMAAVLVNYRRKED